MRTRHQFFMMTVISALMFSSCFDSAILVAGLKTPEEYARRPSADKDMDAVDGVGSLARFTYIQDIAVDSQDNVYVADLYSKKETPLHVLVSMFIRKILPDGTVITLKNAKVNVFNTMAIKEDVLYFPSNDCINTIDLKQSVENLIIKPYWGSCQSGEQNQSLENPPETAKERITLKSNLTLTHDHTLYAVAESSTVGNFIFKLSPNQTQVEKTTFNGSLAKTFGFSHDHRLFIGYFDPPHGPPPMGKGQTYTEIRGPNGLNTIDDLFSKMVFDQKNRLYTYKNSEIVRYDSDWKPKWIGRLYSNSVIQRMVLNPSETALFLASETAVYRVPLPKD